MIFTGKQTLCHIHTNTDKFTFTCFHQETLTHSVQLSPTIMTHTNTHTLTLMQL